MTPDPIFDMLRSGKINIHCQEEATASHPGAPFRQAVARVSRTGIGIGEQVATPALIFNLRRMPWQEVKKITKNLFVNEQIRAREVLVIDAEGNQLGVMALKDALETASQKRLDLVNVAPNARPPVCRLMDFGKYKYEQSKKERDARKKQKIITLKEVKLRPKIEKHDFAVKVKNSRRFLESGDKVKVTVMFRGRELAHPDIAHRLCRQLAQDLEDCAVVERSAKLEGRNMTMILSPKS